MRVAELWRYPVKSLRGERLDAVDVLADGLRGDRLTQVVDGRGERMTGRTVPELLGIAAALDGAGKPLVDGAPWDSEEAAARIRSVAGGDTSLAPLGRHFDPFAVHVVTDAAVAALGEDRRRLRPNVLIAGSDGTVESDWVGRRLRIGGAELQVRMPCERCIMTTIDPDTQEVRTEVLERINSDFDGDLGLYCDVAVAGPVAIGDPVELA